MSKRFDLLFVCGLAPWILGVVAYFCTGGVLGLSMPSPQQQALSIAFVALALLVGESHQFTSVLRYYGSFRHRRDRYVWQRVPMWIMYVLIGLGLFFTTMSSASINIPSLLGSILGAIVGLTLGPIVMFAGAFFPVFLMQHFCAQAKSVGLVYCRAQKFDLSPWETSALSVVTWLLVLTGAATIAVPFGANSLSSPSTPQQTLYGTTLCVVVMTVGYFISRGIHENRWLPQGASLTWLNMALFVLLAQFPLMLYVWLFVPIAFHASQHWALAWRTQQMELGRQSVSQLSDRKTRMADAFRLILPVQVLSVVILFGTLLFDRVTGNSAISAQQTLPLAFSMLVFYFHYFTDRIVWRSKH